MKISDGGSRKIRNLPEPQHAVRLYLVILALSLISGIWFVEWFGLQLNLWINQILFIFLPVALTARAFNWDIGSVFRFRRPRYLILLFSCVAGLGIGFIAASAIPAVERLLARSLGPPPSALLLMDRVNYFEMPLEVTVVLGLVLLAPFCEGLFFRGVMQRSFEVYGINRGWAYSGILFGLLYVVNGVGSIGPFVILGLIAGYITLLSGSIWNAMALHSVCNITILFVGPLMGIRSARALESFWTIALPIIGVCLLILSVLFIRNRARGLSEMAEDEKTDATDSRHYSVLHQPLRRSLAMWCAILIILGTGFAEGVLRTGTFSLPGRTLSDSARTRVSVVQNRMTITSIDVTDLRQGRSATLSYSYSVYSSEADMSVAVVDPNGRVVNSTTWKGTPVNDSSVLNEVTMTQPGIWNAVVIGFARDLDIIFEWSVVYR